MPTIHNLASSSLIKMVSLFLLLPVLSSSSRSYFLTHLLTGLDMLLLSKASSLANVLSSRPRSYFLTHLVAGLDMLKIRVEA
jgi:hypothetical protein